VRPAEPELNSEHVLSEEDVVTGILRTAALGCDRVVQTSHGATGLTRWCTGRIAEEVVRRDACPVLVVKPTGKAEHLPGMTSTPLHRRAADRE
jgi:nucleotide-binding universal stress UspA family protein